MKLSSKSLQVAIASVLSFSVLVSVGGSAMAKRHHAKNASPQTSTENKQTGTGGQPGGAASRN